MKQVISFLANIMVLWIATQLFPHHVVGGMREIILATAIAFIVNSIVSLALFGAAIAWIDRNEAYFDSHELEAILIIIAVTAVLGVATSCIALAIADNLISGFAARGWAKVLIALGWALVQTTLTTEVRKTN